MAFRTNKVPAIEERTVSGSSVSFHSNFALPLKSCKVSFSATQAGSGEPSPSNPRAISGVSAIGLTANSTPVSVSLGDTRYGGELDVLNGLLKLTHYHFVPNSSSVIHLYDHGTVTSLFDITYKANNIPVGVPNTILSSHFSYNISGSGKVSNGETLIFCTIANSLISPENAVGFKAWLIDNSVEFVYEMATPITIQLSANELSSIIGNNTFSTDAGTLEITFADLQEKSASGAVASFNTALAMPLASCNIAVNAWQEGSGDPSPDNVRPIHGFSEVNATRAGLNIKPNSGNTGTSEGVSVVYNPVDETYTLNGTFSRDGGNIVLGDYSNLDWKIGERYRLSVHVVSGSFTLGSGTGITYAVGIFDFQSRVYIRGGTNLGASGLETYSGNGVAFKSNGNYRLYFQLWRTGTVFNNLKIKVQIEKNVGEATRPYEPYVTPTIYTIQLGQEVYGGTVDLVSGVAHLTNKAVVFNENSAITVYYQAYIKSDATACYMSDSDIYPSTSAGAKLGGLSDKTKGAAAMIWANTGYVNRNAINYQNVYINIDNDLLGITDYTQETPKTALAKFKAWLANNPVTVLVPVDLTIQLTPQQIETLIGNNTIFADTGDVDLTFNDLDIAKRGSFREVFKLPS